MEVLKGIGRFILSIVTFVLVIILTCVISCGSLVLVSENYFKEDSIKQMVKSIDVMDFLKDENGEDLEEIKEIKTKVEEAGLPVEAFEEFMESEDVQNVISSIILSTTDYIIYGKEIEIPEVSSDQIYTFLEENMSLVVTKLQENNVPNSELLTEEKQQLVLDELKKQLPIIEEQVNEMAQTIEDEMKENATVNSYQNDVDQALSIVRFIYSSKLKTMFVGTIVLLIVGIMLSRRSLYKGIKWVGISFLFAGGLLAFISILIPQIQKETLVSIPYAFVDFFNIVFDNMISTLTTHSIVCISLAVILIVINIVIHVIKEKRENKEFEI